MYNPQKEIQHQKESSEFFNSLDFEGKIQYGCTGFGANVGIGLIIYLAMTTDIQHWLLAILFLPIVAISVLIFYLIGSIIAFIYESFF